GCTTMPPAYDNTSSMECKMLRASVCAYSVERYVDKPDAAVPLKDGFCEYLPPLKQAYGIVTGERDIITGQRTDSGYIALLPDSSAVLAFRGTLPPGGGNSPHTVIRDWLQNAASLPVPIGDGGSMGRVHDGFNTAFEGVWDRLEDTVKQWRKDG